MCILAYSASLLLYGIDVSSFRVAILLSKVKESSFGQNKAAAGGAEVISLVYQLL